MKKESDPPLLKDEFFNEETVGYIARIIAEADEGFDARSFCVDALKKFPDLELKQRISHMGVCLKKHLPQGYEEALGTLLASLRFADGEKFVFACYSEFVEIEGCHKEHLAASLDALGTFTEYCSAEFAIRKFLNEFPKESFGQMLKWSKDANVHRRRLASEGLRPKLPWAKAIDIDHREPIKILDNLFYDNERYVTRSVANHLNDLSKIDAPLALSMLKRWRDSGKQNDREMSYVCRHALRTLIKRGDKDALAFLGFHPVEDVKVSNFDIVRPDITLGDTLEFSFDVSSKSDVDVLVDYRITYATPHKKQSAKVFKLKQLHLDANRKYSVQKKHPLRKMTTKKLYSGKHAIELMVNGRVIAKNAFTLSVPN